MNPAMAHLLRHLITAALGMLAVVVLGGASGLLAQEASGDVTLDMKHRGITLEVGDPSADVELALTNNTSTVQEFDIQLSGVPSGWDVDIWNPDFDYKVRSVALRGAESQQMRLRIEPPGGITEDQTHPMTIRLVAPDGQELDRAGFEVRVLPDRPKEPGDVQVASTYPVLRGSVGNLFEFELDIRNKTGANASFNLSAEALPEWLIEFIPAFGEGKRITSVSMVDNGNERVKVRVTPPSGAPVGDYPIIARVGNDQTESETTLLLTLTGKGVTTVTTGNGRLNVDANAGDPAPVAFRIGNTGTAELRNIQLAARAPEGWAVQFQLNPIPLLPTNNIIDIPTEIVPPANALPGDYLVMLQANNPDSEASLDIRVTVGQSTIWGWVGIGIVLLVLVGLGGLFVRLGRR